MLRTQEKRFVLVSPYTFIQAWEVFLTQNSLVNILHVSDFHLLTILKNVNSILLCPCDRVHETIYTPINEWMLKLWVKDQKVFCCFVFKKHVKFGGKSDGVRSERSWRGKNRHGFGLNTLDVCMEFSNKKRLYRTQMSIFWFNSGL